MDVQLPRELRDDLVLQLEDLVHRAVDLDHADRLSRIDVEELWRQAQPSARALETTRQHPACADGLPEALRQRGIDG